MTYSGIVATATNDCSMPTPEQDCLLPSSLIQRHHRRVVGQFPAPVHGEHKQAQSTVEDVAKIYKEGSEKLATVAEAEEAHAHTRAGILLQENKSSATVSTDESRAAAAVGATVERAQEVVGKAENTLDVALTSEALVATRAKAQAPGAELEMLGNADEAHQRASHQLHSKAHQLHDKAHQLHSKAQLLHNKALETKVAEVIDLAIVAEGNAADATSRAAMSVQESMSSQEGVSIAALLNASEGMAEAAKEHELASQKALVAKKGEEKLVKLQTAGLPRDTAINATALQQSSAAVQVRFLLEEAAKMRSEANMAKEEATNAQHEALEAEGEEQRLKGEEEICHWKMPPWCAPAFQYRDLQYGQCVSDDHPRPWCSHDRSFSGSWSECSLACEPKSRVDRLAKRMVLSQTAANVTRLADQAELNSTSDQFPAGDPIAMPPGGMAPNYLVPVYIPAINLQSAGGTTQSGGMRGSRNGGFGAAAALDESGYMSVSSRVDTPEMTMYVRRAIAKIGCLITDELALAGFVPWYSGEADEQSFTKLDSELRCLCTRGQGPQWLQPIDPNNPPRGGMLECTGRRFWLGRESDRP